MSFRDEALTAMGGATWSINDRPEQHILDALLAMPGVEVRWYCEVAREHGDRDVPPRVCRRALSLDAGHDRCGLVTVFPGDLRNKEGQ